jgi:hypothetical protein
LNLVVFEGAEDLAPILAHMGLRFDGARILQDDKPVKCECCGDELTLSSVGNVMPGSTLFYCDDPFCLTDYVAEHQAF